MVTPLWKSLKAEIKIIDKCTLQLLVETDEIKFKDLDKRFPLVNLKVVN
jgi:hypothetical protein